MRIVLLKDVRTQLGIHHSGRILPARADGQGGWIVQITPIRRDGRIRTAHVPAGAARPVYDPEWRARSACRDVPGDAWYPSAESWGADAREARKVCAGCPVRPECARAALDANEVHGIFAGVSVRLPGAREKLTAIAAGAA